MAELSVADFEALSAYVDGALPVAEAAEFAARIAEEPALALACARLSALKAATAARLSSDAPPPNLRMPASRPTFSARHRAWQPSAPALAASVCAFVVGALLAAVLPTAPPFRDPQVQTEAPATVLDLHDRWGMGSAKIPEDPGLRPWPASIMAAAQLRLAFVDEIPGQSVTMRHEGYIGKNGCKVSLFSVAQASPLAIGPIGGDVSVAAWTSEGGQFALVARSMDAKRFALLAEAIREGQSPAGPPEALLAAVRERPSSCS